MSYSMIFLMFLRGAILPLAEFGLKGFYFGGALALYFFLGLGSSLRGELRLGEGFLRGITSFN
jgi:hypothetical protein